MVQEANALRPEERDVDIAERAIVVLGVDDVMDGDVLHGGRIEAEIGVRGEVERVFVRNQSEEIKQLLDDYREGDEDYAAIDMEELPARAQNAGREKHEALTAAYPSLQPILHPNNIKRVFFAGAQQ